MVLGIDGEAAKFIRQFSRVEIIQESFLTYPSRCIPIFFSFFFLSYWETFSHNRAIADHLKTIVVFLGIHNKMTECGTRKPRRSFLLDCGVQGRERADAMSLRVEQPRSLLVSLNVEWCTWFHFHVTIANWKRIEAQFGRPVRKLIS